MQAETKYKYIRHSEKQYDMILQKAKALFIKQGINSVSISDITEACGIMRATFYRYFKNKDTVVWTIFHENSDRFAQKLIDGIHQSGGCTFNRFSVLMDIIRQIFNTDIDQFHFLNVFGCVYQKVTSVKDSPLYNQYFTPNDFRTGDTVRLLETNFHDGSVKACLDPHRTSVALCYGALSIASSFSEQIETLPSKYGVTAVELLRLNLDCMLESIKP